LLKRGELKEELKQEEFLLLNMEFGENYDYIF
jgi:hypothetical protein